MRKDLPLKEQSIAIEVMIITSRPSRNIASHNRNCCEKGKVLTNRVMYHFVPHDDEDIIFFCYSYQLVLP